jgi:acyl-coenzyme A synthetase/AMP-(fatty) acid ligase
MTPPSPLSHTAQYIAQHARQTPESIAIIEAGTHVTYAALANDLVRYVRALQRIPVRPGMLVGVEATLRYLHLQVLLACQVLGAATISLGPAELASDHPMNRVCDLLLVCGERSAHHPQRKVVMTMAWLDEVAATPVDPEDLALLDQPLPGDIITRIARSSSTTGAAKLILVSLATQNRIVARNAEWIARDLAPRQRFLYIYHLTIRSVYHRALGCLQQGGTIYFTIESDALDLIAAGTVNAAMFLVGDAERLLRDARPPPPGHTLLVWAIGAAASPALRRLIRQRLNAIFISYYSSNETGRVAQIDDDNVGTLCPGVEVRIVDEAGRDKSRGETGFILVKNETMVNGYHNDPALTASRFVDGWFHTRDMGCMPAPDRLIVIGRADNVLNVGGVKLSPGPIEAQIKTIAGITDAALLQIDKANQSASLLVALETSTGDLPPGFAEQFDPIMAPYMMAFKLMLTPQFPRTDTGKVKRGDLTNRYRQSQMRIPT